METKHWSKIQVGDRVAIKGVRSHLNGRRRMAGTASYVSRDLVVVDCGTRIVHTRPSSLVYLGAAY